MTETNPTVNDQELMGIKQLLWGNNIKSDIFRRWSQGTLNCLINSNVTIKSQNRSVGFSFSATEKSALEQTEGGPCSIIAPVQAFILKNLLLEYEGLSFRDVVSIVCVYQ